MLCVCGFLARGALPFLPLGLPGQPLRWAQPRPHCQPRRKMPVSTADWRRWTGRGNCIPATIPRGPHRGNPISPMRILKDGRSRNLLKFAASQRLFL